MSWPAFMSELAFVIAMLLLICPLLVIQPRLWLQLRRQPAQQPKPSARVGGSPWN